MAKKIYPLTPEALDESIQNLVVNGQHLSGKKAVNPKPKYFLNFRVKRHSQADSEILTVIANQNTSVKMECVKHHFEFIATPRGLLNTSEPNMQTTCRFCERDYGVGKNFVTLGEAKAKISESEAFDWIIDEDKLAGDIYNLNQILKSHDKVPLRCKRLIFGGSVPCNSSVEHFWSNIQYALDVDPDHIHCQGPCDSKKKGKARRKSLEDIELLITQKRDGAWRLTVAQEYRKISEPIWFTHLRCGNKVFRLPLQILDYPEHYVLQKNTDDDCPYCTCRSPLGCINQSISQYKKWIEHVTSGRIVYIEDCFPKSDKIKLAFKCTCGAFFKATQMELLKYEYYGCKTCAQEAIRSLRAWDLEEAKTIVERRNMLLVGNPKAYNLKASITDHEGRVQPFDSILELVKDMPVHALGYGKRPEPIQPQDVNSGKPYSNEALNFLKNNKSKMSYREIACILGRSEGSVKQKFRDLGIRNDEREHFKRINSVWDDAFFVDTAESCYWAGLLATDGTVVDKGDMKISLKAIDEDVLQEFAKYLRFSGNLNYRTVSLVGGRGIYAELRFRSNRIREDIACKFGICPRKTFNIPAPLLTNGSLLARAYIVGLIEGDGHLRRNRRGELALNYVSASHDLFMWVVDQVSIILGKKIPWHMRERKQKVFWTITIHCNDAEKLKEQLLNAFTGKMRRKWDV